jgi:hypothetical protein
MSINASSFSAGYTGSVIVANTSAKTGRFRGFVVNADAVVSAILDQSAASLMTTLGLSGVTLKQGTFIAVADGNYISSITLASGSVVMYGE